MAFPWYDSPAPPAVAATFADKRDDMIRRTVKDHAGLLLRLGRSKKEATRRCKQNLEWEYELQRLPAVAKEVPDIVDAVYARS